MVRERRAQSVEGLSVAFKIKLHNITFLSQKTSYTFPFDHFAATAWVFQVFDHFKTCLKVSDLVLLSAWPDPAQLCMALSSINLGVRCITTLCFPHLSRLPLPVLVFLLHMVVSLTQWMILCLPAYLLTYLFIFVLSSILNYKPDESHHIMY